MTQKALGIVKLRNKVGLEAWRQMTLDYEARMSKRFTAMLRFILIPASEVVR